MPVDSLEFQKTDLTDVTYDLDWVKGFTIYDGNEILKKDYQFGKSLNVPAYFNEHGHEYVLIKVTTETIAKNLVDKIIENNGGKKKFKADSVDGWFYPHKTDCFTVGFLIEHSVVRINKLLSPKSKGILTTDLIPEVELPENLKIHGIEHVYDFDKIVDINQLLHVPLLGTDSRMNNGQMIFIRSTTKELCKNLVDEIIDKNGGLDNFEDVTKLATTIFGSMSEYFFQNDSFSILILPQYPAVRINLFTEGGYSKFKDIEV